MEPNKHHLLLWYRALKSGQYHQTRGALERYSTAERFEYCCLGVACRVAIANGLALNVQENADGHLYTQFGCDGSEVSLPREVVEWFGFDVRLGGSDWLDGSDPQVAVTGEGVPISAIQANDGLLWSFDEIADSIYELYGLAEVDDAAV